LFLRPFETSAPRTAASIHLGSVVVVCILAALSMPGLPMANGASSPKLVRVIGAPETNKPCGNQTWPYIEERCLTQASAPNAPTRSAQTPQPQPQAASAASTSGAGNPSAELSPLTAVNGPVVPGKAASRDTDSRSTTADAGAAHAATTGIASAEDEQQLPVQPEPPRKRHRHHGFFFGFRF
jgi:hypothetical protein